MKAVLIKAFGGPENLVIEDVPDPMPGPGQIVVDVYATALNRADLLQRRGKYPPPKGETDIMGLECSGVVAQVGQGVTRVKGGTRVMALLPGGGYAEKVVIDERMAIPVPEKLTLVEAAAVPESFLTAREALFTLGHLTPGSSVLIHAAAGGVGSAAVQLARHLGAQVLATASAEKHDFVRNLGAHQVIDYKTEDFAQLALEATKRRGVDVVVDFIGAPYWEKHASCMGSGGRCVVVGVLGGAQANVNLGALLFKRHQILGLVMRSRPLSDKIAFTQSFINDCLANFESGALRPLVDSVYDMANVAAAHTYMETNANRGKIVLKIRTE